MLNRCDPYVTPPDSRLVRLVLANAREITRGTVLPVVRLGDTDGRFFRRAGIPTVVYGPAVHNMGGPDEYIGRRIYWTSPSPTPVPSPTC